ncbi:MULTISPECIES: hypothetical protein [Burkholderiaceae]|uniref:hypothetical protein n=1 Tax=Burkholderiaceae TaxID=119060 RepID=UPI00158DA517|nr:MULTISPECIES: hypothetical protein [Burkholderiaceae]
MRKLLNRLFGSDGKYKGEEYCETCSGKSNPWVMKVDGDSVLFYERAVDGYLLHEFSKKELKANNDEFYFYEDYGVRSSIEKPMIERHEKVKIVFGEREIRILASNRNIVFRKCLL